MSAPTELVKGNVVVLILSCLAKEPMHGYRIAKSLEAQSEGYFVMREGTLYPHLHQMEKDGLIEGYWETVSGDRRRRYYRIADKGRAELARRSSQWRVFRRKIDQALGLAEA